MWALLLTLAAAPALEVAPRPDGVAKGALVQVVLGEGTVTIRAATSEFPARRGMLLVATDTVVVAPRGWVVLHLLENGHAVRLDDELSLRVDQLALLKAPKQPRDLQAQLNELVTRQEQESARRLIGWNASQTAANVPQGSSQDEADTGGGGNAKSLESVQKQPPKPPGHGGKGTREEPPARWGGGKDVAPPPGQPPPPTEAPKPVVAAATPGGVLQSDAALDACVSASVKRLGAEVVKALKGQLILRVKARDGRAVVQLPFGLPTPQCALKWFETKPLRPEWVDVTVTLK